LKHGRFNAWGTMIAVLMLGTGVTGLALAAAPPWSSDMFVGVVLLSALAATGVQRRKTVAAGRPGVPAVGVPAEVGAAVNGSSGPSAISYRE
jgi:ribose transport system permease protein